MNGLPKVLLVGVPLGTYDQETQKIERRRAFKGANKALPWLQSSLNNSGFYYIEQFDMEDPDNSIEALVKKSNQFDQLWYAGTFNVSLDLIDVISDKVHEKNPATQQLLGGYGAAGFKSIAKDMPQIKAAYYGPGIEHAPKIVNAIAQNRFDGALRNKEIPGLSFYDFNASKFVKGVPVQLPSQEAFDTIDQQLGLSYVPLSHDMDDISEGKWAQLMVQLGCPWICYFCAESGGEDQQMFLKREKHSGKTVIELTKEGIDKNIDSIIKYGANNVYLDDETGTRNGPLLIYVVNELAKNGIRTSLHTRNDMIYDKVIRAIAPHIDYCFTGTEHINPRVTLAINKFLGGSMDSILKQALAYPNKVMAAYSTLKKYGVPKSNFNIIGLPKLDDTSWEKLLQGKIESRDQLTYQPTTIEDDVESIHFCFEKTRPEYFNLNVLRFNVDDNFSWRSEFSSVRPTGNSPVDARYFISRLRKKNGIIKSEYHPYYRVFEAMDPNQCFTTAITPDRAHRTMEEVFRLASETNTYVYVDRELIEKGMVWKKDGKWGQAPLKEFEQL